MRVTTKDIAAGRGRRNARWARFLVAAGLVGAAIACHRGGRDRDSTSGDEGERIERETCVADGHDAHPIDVDGNGTPDLVDVFDGDRRLCTTMDLDFDGDVDLSRFYERDGTTTRLEIRDLDFDGKVDQVAVFENGERVRQELDTDFDDRMDVLMWCEAGRATRVERRRHHRRGIDTWETYENGMLSEARYDEDGDGEAERIEHYRDGRLVAEDLDRNGDGEIQDDEHSTIEDEFAGTPQRMMCDPNAVEAAERAMREHDEGSSNEPSTPANPASNAADAGVADAGGRAPWEMPRDGGVVRATPDSGMVIGEAHAVVEADAGRDAGRRGRRR